MLDRLISEFDRGLRTLLAPARSARPHPDRALAESALSDDEKKHAAALMRINHCGEVCAQALYSGQSLTSDNPDTAAALQQAAREETEHLAWCAQRVHELGGRTTLLAPLFYGGAFALGALAGAVGNRWNLGFLAETERQVGLHLTRHLDRLPQQDAKSRAILEQMRTDEACHEQTARDHGGAELPLPVRTAMRAFSKAMTTSTYYF